jgi:hypothetical protein
LVLAIFLGAVGIAQATGNWIVSGKQMIDIEQMASSAEIRGWMTLEDLARGLGIDLPALYTVTGIPDTVPPATALKDLEQIVPDLEVSGVRDAIAVYLGEAPSAESAGEQNFPDAAHAQSGEPAATPTPSPPAPTPSATPGQPHDQAENAEHTPLGNGTGPTPLPPGTRLEAGEIKGRHTLQEIATQAEVPLAGLLAELDLAPDADPHQSVRTLVESGQIAEVEDVRSAVATLQAEGR